MFDKFYGFESTSTSNDAKLIDGNLFLATNAGVYHKKWTDYEDKLNPQKFEQIENEAGNIQSNYLDVVDNKLITAATNGLYEIKNFTANYFLTRDGKQLTRGVGNFRQANNSPNVIVGIKGAILIFKKENDKWIFSHDIQNYSGEYLEQDNNGYFWIANQTLGIYKIKFDQEYNEIVETTFFDDINGLKGLPSEKNNKIFKIDNEIVFVTDSGLYKYDQKKNNFFIDEELNNLIAPDGIISFILKDSQGNIWYKERIEQNNLILWQLCQIKKTDSGFVKIKKPFLPLVNKIFFFEQLSNNSYIIGGPNGFVHYDSDIENTYDVPFPAFIRSVKILNVDSTIFNGSFVSEDSIVGFNQQMTNIPIIEHKYGDLRFTFAGSYYQSPDKIEYTFFLEGNDEKWSEWTSENYKDYSNLKPGEYNFQVIARNIYQIKSTVASYEFVIKPPWSQTTLAYFIYMIIVGFFIWLIVYLYTRRLRRQKEYLEEQVKLRTKEIEQQKEEIESQRDKLAGQNDEIQKINKDITSSIEYAKRIQTAMLPLESNIQAHLEDYFILFKPRDIVSGDFYWFTHKNDKTFIAAVDCTGHGVPGAFMSMIGAEILTTIVNNKEVYDAAEILFLLNKYIRTALKQDATENQDGMDMALCVIDKKNETVEFSGAKNPLFVIQDGELTKIKGSRQSIGGYQFGEFEKHTVKYTTPSWFYIFSDGYADQFGGENQSKFMIKHFKKILMNNYQKSMKEQNEILDKAISNWMISTRQTDDILVIGFKL